ncbi:MAG: hypothetical protein NTZ24_13985 [Deltaproteobacteria bacterium]|nr:hypothetical protein [Deltaproteobacteria bacterium]
MNVEGRITKLEEKVGVNKKPGTLACVSTKTFCKRPFPRRTPEDRKNLVIALENLKQTVRNKLDTTSQSSKNLA